MTEEFYKNCWEKGYMLVVSPDNKFQIHKVPTIVDDSSFIHNHTSYDEAMSMLNLLINKKIFSVIVSFNRGFGPEYITMKDVEAKDSCQAKAIAESQATKYFLQKFGKKVTWEEVKLKSK